MAVAAIPVMGAIAGGAMGTAVAGAMGWGLLGTAIASSLGSTLISSAMTGGIDNLFDDPLKALTTIAIGAAMGYAANASIFKDMPSSQAQAAGAMSSGAEASGNIYSASPSQMVKKSIDAMTNAEGTLSHMPDIIKDYQAAQSQPFIGDLMKGSGQGYSEVLTKQGADDLFVDSAMYKFKASGNELTNYEALAQQVGGDIDMMPPGQYRMLREQEIFGDFNYGQGSDVKASSPFNYQEEKASGFADFSAKKTGQALEGIDSYEKPYKLPKGGMSDPFPSYTPSRTSDIPGINQDKGSMEYLSGVSGMSEDELYNNKVTAPMVQAYKRQRDKMQTLAQKSWGLMNATRVKGLMT